MPVLERRQPEVPGKVPKTADNGKTRCATPARENRHVIAGPAPARAPVGIRWGR